MNSLTLSTLPWFPWYFLILLIPVCASPNNNNNNIPRLGIRRETLIPGESSSDTTTLFAPEEFKSFAHTQSLDHFNYRPDSYATFKQRYVVNFKYWDGANTSAPIFVYLGGEAPIHGDLKLIGFLPENAPRFKALLVYIEHRFYGKSVPFGSMEDAMNNDTTRGYFNSAQAIADYADLILYLKKKLSAQNSPVIVFGASYGGMLASWFRLKYPHVALGALASSAPILYFENITPHNSFFSIVTKDFKELSESCYQTIRKSWSEIDNLASKSNGLSILSWRFKTCTDLNNTSELKDYLRTIYTKAAQYNDPPTYPVTVVCGGIDGANEGTEVLSRIFAGVVAYKGNRSCYDVNEYNYPTETNVGWGWQKCSEMVMPIGRGGNGSMFPSAPFDIKQFTNDCTALYGVLPRPHWITTYYGGHDIKLILGRFASNIIFSNGLRDPYSSGGVLEDLSLSLPAIKTVNGSHGLDLLASKTSDPEWLTEQRETEAQIIEKWITKYYADLPN